MTPSTWDSAPLSSFGQVPATGDTLRLLAEAGVVSPPDLTEAGAQSLLVLCQYEDNRATLRSARDAAKAAGMPGGFGPADPDAPACHGREYDPQRVLCGGCVFSPSCWRRDVAYLGAVEAGTLPPPPGVPPHVVAARVADVGALAASIPPPPPPLRRLGGPGLPPPPPPKRR